jgi:hypothetical protein
MGMPFQLSCRGRVPPFRDFEINAAERRKPVMQRQEQSAALTLLAHRISENRPHLGFHRSAVPRRPNPQPLLHPVVKIANAHCRHGHDLC